MLELFKHYPQPDNYKPDNYPKCHCKHELTVMAGELAKHTFEIPLNLNELEGFEVIYRLGNKPIIIKDNYQVEYFVINEHTSIINCTLLPYETALFGKTFLDAQVQIKFYGADDTISYSEIYEIKLSDAIDLNRDSYEKPDKPKDTNIVFNGGYGYTED